MKIIFPIPIQAPLDGFDPLEQAFLRQMIIDIYKDIENPEDKFIIIATHGMGYTQEVVAEMLNTSQVQINIRIKKIFENIKRNKRFKNAVR